MPPIGISENIKAFDKEAAHPDSGSGKLIIPQTQSNTLTKHPIPETL